MKKLLIISLFVCSLFGSEAEKMFWDEVKDTNDIEMLKLYKKRYPNGIFESLADLKIKRLKKTTSSEETSNGKPLWIKGYSKDYKFYAVGKANKHFKGIEYQENLAQKRATNKLIDKMIESNLSKDDIDEMLSLTQTKKYIDDRKRIYILIYIDNDNL